MSSSELCGSGSKTDIFRYTLNPGSWRQGCMILSVSGSTRTAKFDKRTLLSAHPFFNALDDAVLDWLVPRARSRKVEKGTVVFQKGDPGTELFIVCSGAVRISSPSEQGSDAVFNLMIRGDIFGEIAFLDHGPGSGDGVCV